MKSEKLAGFECPRCKDRNSRIVESRWTAEGKKRMRICQKCGHSCITLEVAINE